jgi:hypothetical protein
VPAAATAAHLLLVMVDPIDDKLLEYLFGVAAKWDCALGPMWLLTYFGRP